MQDLNKQLYDKLRQFLRYMREGHVSGTICPYEQNAEGPGTPVFHRDLILGEILDEQGEVPQKDLARQMNISPSTLSSTLDRLVKEGFITRRNDPCDRRAVLLSLTDKGVERAVQFQNQQVQILSYYFRNLNDVEKRTAIDLVEKMLGKPEV